MWGGGGGGKGINWPAILTLFSMMCFNDHDVGYQDPRQWVLCRIGFVGVAFDRAF